MAQSVIVKNKEIRVKNPQMVVEDENRAELIEFTITNAYSIEDVEGMIFHVQFRNKLGEVGMDTLVNAYPSEIVHNDMLVLDWLPSASFTKERGKIEIQIIGFTESLVETSDSTYQSGKMYFSDSTGTFLPVYPSTSEHSPKVGDEITGTVYENQVTGEDHRWSTEKCQLMLPENIYDNGTPVYTEAQVKSLITQIQEELSYANINALKAEGFAVGEQNGTPVGSSSPYDKNNASYYNTQAQTANTLAQGAKNDAVQAKSDAENSADLAEDWAIKTDGTVGDTGEYSAKYYAGEAGDYAEDADNARIVSVSETQSPDDGGTNVVVITYKDGTTFTFFVKNGNAGTPFTIYKTYSSIAEMNADFANVPEGRFVIISSSVSDPDNSKMYVRGAEAFTFVTDLSGAQGIQGPAGQAATITVGTVSTGAAGSSASIFNSGTSSAAVFDFVIPKGDKGEQGIQGIQGEKGDTGDTPVLSIGSVTYGDTPTVTIDTTDPDNPVLNFVLKTSEVGVVDNLNSSSSVDALSAKQGKVLDGKCSDLKSAITAIDHRVENLEQPKGGYVVENYKDGSITPSGKGDWAVVEGLRGVSRVENQLMQSWNFSTQYPWSRNSGTTTLTVANNKAIVTHDSAPSVSYDGGILASHYPMKVISGHTYLVCYGIKTSVACSMTAYFEGCGYFTAGAISANTQSKYMALKTATSSVDEVNLILLPNNAMVFGAGDTEEYSEVIIRDLNVYFGGTIPSDADTIAEIQQNYPHLLTPSEYGVRIVDSSYSGVRAKGVNLWNEKWIVGGLNNYTGLPDASRTNRVSSEDFIPISQYKLYYYLNTADVAWLYFYDKDKNYIGRYDSNSASFTPLAGSAFMKFETWNGYGNVYKHDVQISEVFNNTVTTLNTTYHPYMESTLSLSFTGKSAGSVYDSCEPNVEVGGVAKKRTTERVGSYTFTGQEEWKFYPAPDNRFYVTIFANQIKKIAISEVGNILLPSFVPKSASVQYNQHPDYSVASDTSGSLLIYVASWVGKTTAEVASLMAGKPINYELADPIVTLSDPLLDNTLLTEAGGRMATVQTGTVVDGSFDLGFINL